MGILGGITFAWTRAAFRLRLINSAATTTASSAPSRMARPPISSDLLEELVVGVPVLLPPLFPEVAPFDAGVWLPTTVGDAPTVGVAVALAVAVGVTVGVVVGEGVGDGVDDGLGVGEGDTTGAL